VDIFLWMDKDGDGTVTEGKVINYLKRMGLCRFDGAGGKSSSFAYFDKNKDRCLSLRELSSG
jgi:Ca2+-binding EF-hand superfamily protein